VINNNKTTETMTYVVFKELLLLYAMEIQLT